jgi:hypothetical protein
MSRINQINTLTDLLCLEAGIVHYMALVDEEDENSLDKILGSLQPEQARKMKRNFRKQLRRSVKSKEKRDSMLPGARRRSVMTRMRNKAWNIVVKSERALDDDNL